LSLKADQAEEIATSVLDASDRNDLDSRLVLALVATESNFRQTAVSRAGALGLGQLMPRTAGSLGVTDPFDVEQNVEGSAEVPGDEIERMAARHGRKKAAVRDIHLALACYNAGPGAVRRYGGVPPFRETNHYAKRVTGLYYQFAGPGGLPPVGQPLWP
jgi:soluble lytic murein transglycosylase-like protein